jgi:hypothetical protein
MELTGVRTALDVERGMALLSAQAQDDADEHGVA